MLKKVFILVILCSIAMLFSHAIPDSIENRPSFAADRVKIQLTEIAYTQTDIPEEMYAEVEFFEIKELDAHLKDVGVTKIQRAHRKVKDTVWEKQTGFDRWFILKFPEGKDILKILEILRTSPYVEEACLENIYYSLYIPNDPYYPNNWGHNNTAQLPAWVGYENGSHSGSPVGTAGFDCNAPQAWNDSQGLGSSLVIIGIIDTGVDSSHPDLRLVPGFSSIGDDPNDTSPLGSHGTACAGIAAAIGNNALGVVGIAAGCSVMPLRAGTSYGFYHTPLANAVTYAADHNVDIISMSLGGYNPPNADYVNAIQYAHNQGVVMFASSGNDDQNTITSHPANSPYVISVGAASPGGERKSSTSCDGEYWWGSNWGPDIQDDPAAVDIMAPTTLPTTDIMGASGYTSGDYYLYFSGTSCSCPYAAGVAALLLSKYPSLNSATIRSILTSTATDMTIDGGIGWDQYTGYGLVNAEAALAALPSAGAKIWTGVVSSNWHLSSNWENGVPLINDDVMINPVSTGNYYPSVISGQASCKNLFISTGASLTVTAYSLTIDRNLNCFGNLNITGAATVIVNGIVDWGNGSGASFTHSNALLKVLGNMYFKAGSNVNITNGTVEFSGTVGAGIYCYATASINNLVNSKSGSMFGFSDSSTHDFYVNGNFTNLNERYFRNYSPQTIYLAGNFINNINGVFYWDAGTLCFNGSTTQSIQNYSSLNCYFNNIKVAKTTGSTVNMTSNIIAYGSVSITGGILNSNNYNISLKGNWYNSVGADAFIEGGGAVIFNGNSNQYIYNETFAGLFLDKPSGELIIPSASFVVCDGYWWFVGTLRIDGGTLVAVKLANDGIYGTIYVDGGLLDLRQDEFGRNDLNCNMHISGGIVKIGGGSTSENMWGYGIGEVSLNMTGGVLDFLNQTIYISDQIGDIYFSVTGGTIRTSKSYICPMNDIDFSGGTLELYNPGEAYIQLHSTCSLHNLVVNKTISRSDVSIDTARNNRLDFAKMDSNLLINGNLSILGGPLIANGFNINLKGDWYDYNAPAGFEEGISGRVIFSGNTNQICYGETFYVLEIAKPSGLVIIPAGTSTISQYYDWTAGGYIVEGGLFKTHDILDSSIFGTITLNSGSIEYNQVTGTGSNYVNLRGSLTINGGTFTVNGGTSPCDFTNTTPPTLIMTGGVLDFQTVDLRISDTGNFNYNLTGGIIKTAGYIEITKTDFLPSGGNFEMYGSTDKNISCHPGSSLYSLIINKSSRLDSEPNLNQSRDQLTPYRSNTVLLNSDLLIRGNLTISNGIFNSNGYNINIHGNWSNLVGPEAFIEGAATVTFSGTSDQYCLTSENFYTVNVNKSNALMIDNASVTVTIASYKWTAGTVKVIAGTLTISDLYYVNINGNYYVYEGGTINFNQDTSTRLYLSGFLYVYGGTMTFAGGHTSYPYLQSPNNDNAGIYMTHGLIDLIDRGLYLAPSATYTVAVNITGGTIRAARSSFRIQRDNVHLQNCVVELHSNVPCTIYVYETSSLCHLVLNKVNATATMESNVTLTGDLTINTGILNAQNYSLTARNIYNSRTIRKEYTGTIKAEINFVWNTGSTNPNFTSGNIAFGQNLVFNSGSSVNLSGTPVIFDGAGYGSILSNSSTAQLGALTLNGNSGGFGDLQVSLLPESTEPLKVNGVLTINQGNYFKLNSETLLAGGDIILNGNGKLILGPGSFLKFADTKSLTVNSGSTLEVMGENLNPATITHQTGNYALNIESGGKIKGWFAIFEYMNADGVNIKDGGIVDDMYSLHYCIFQNGAASGTLLTINNSASFTIYNAVFPENSWSGASNVRKTINQGSVTMQSATGLFAGESYDDDDYNLISWMTYQHDLLIESFSCAPVGELYVCEPVEFWVRVKNNSSVPANNVMLAFYYNLSQEPDDYTQEDVMFMLPRLNPNGWFDFPHQISSTNAGTWNTWVRVDPHNEIPENMELNNNAGPLVTTWLPLPVVNVTSIQYNELTEEVELTWTYPTNPSVNQFNVYKSISPYGPFETLAGSSTGNTFSDDSTGTKYFYQVKAEKNWP